MLGALCACAVTILGHRRDDIGTYLGYRTVRRDRQHWAARNVAACARAANVDSDIFPVSCAAVHCRTTGNLRKGIQYHTLTYSLDVGCPRVRQAQLYPRMQAWRSRSEAAAPASGCYTSALTITVLALGGSPLLCRPTSQSPEDDRRRQLRGRRHGSASLVPSCATSGRYCLSLRCLSPPRPPPPWYQYYTCLQLRISMHYDLAGVTVAPTLSRAKGGSLSLTDPSNAGSTTRDPDVHQHHPRESCWPRPPSTSLWGPPGPHVEF